MKIIYILLATSLLASPILDAARHSHKEYSRSEIEDAEKKVIKMINKEREKEGLRPLKQWKELSNCARKHSQNMADEKVAFGHDGFKERGKEMKKHARWKRFGENVAYSRNVQDPLKTAVTGWMNSPGHRKNIMGDYEETGMGIAWSEDGKFYITQLFATRM